jgi:hypothetical protein
MLLFRAQLCRIGRSQSMSELRGRSEQPAQPRLSWMMSLTHHQKSVLRNCLLGTRRLRYLQVLEASAGDARTRLNRYLCYLGRALAPSRDYSACFSSDRWPGQVRTQRRGLANSSRRLSSIPTSAIRRRPNSPAVVVALPLPRRARISARSR